MDPKSHRVEPTLDTAGAPAPAAHGASSPAVPPAPATAKRGLRRFAMLMGLLATTALCAALGGVFGLYALWHRLPDVSHLADYDPKLPMRIYDRDGLLLAEYGEERREYVPIDEIPPVMRQALLAIEDARFYEHGAVDFGGLARAAWSNVAAGGHAQGGSTITMQVARVFFLSREKTYARKLTEILLAYKLESVYSKDKLLELYMNQVYLGERAYGFAAAASIYFDKTLAELTPAEAAMLAGLPKAPSAFNPLANRERAVLRQQYILQRMFALGHLDASAYQAARAEPLALRPPAPSIVPSTAYVVEQARQMMVARFGEDAAYTLGLDVHTTIALPEQQVASRALRGGLQAAQDRRGYAGPEGRAPGDAPPGDLRALRAALAPHPDSGTLRAALVREASPAGGIVALLRDGTEVRIARGALAESARRALQPDAPARLRITPGAVVRVEGGGKHGWRLSHVPLMQGALVSVDVRTGDILALAGGYDFRFNKFDHAVQAERQPGSTFKPFVFSAALEKGYFPGTLVQDAQRIVTPAARGRKAWSPRNYGNSYEGFITARRALVRSKNMVAVNLMQAAGVPHVHEFATRFGFDPALNPPGLPLALGAGAATPLQLAQAYAVFANGGALVQPRLVRKVSTRGDGEVLYEAPAQPPRQQAIPERNAYVMDSMLRDVVRQGTGRGALRLGRGDVAGKTGTSNDARDVWFAGYSSGVAAVVWMGYDQPRSLGNVTGGLLALPVWTDYMKTAVDGRNEMPRNAPERLVKKDGDYVYAEYLFGQCVQQQHAFVRTPLGCALREERRPTWESFSDPGAGTAAP